MTDFYQIHQAPDTPWAMEEFTSISGAGVTPHMKYCVRGKSGTMIAVMLTKEVAEAIVSAVNACDKLVTREAA